LNDKKNNGGKTNKTNTQRGEKKEIWAGGCEGDAKREKKNSSRQKRKLGKHRFLMGGFAHSFFVFAPFLPCFLSEGVLFFALYEVGGRSTRKEHRCEHRCADISPVFLEVAGRMHFGDISDGIGIMKCISFDIVLVDGLRGVCWV
jgi:hypothetical protein